MAAPEIARGGGARAAVTAGPALAAGLGGMVFALAAAPGLTGLDAGELGAAARELGIAHPPGFPVFTQIHALVMLLVPVGDAAFRGNLASGLLGALTLGAVAAAARVHGARPAAAVAGALLTGLAGLFFVHALTIEVYTGAALLTAALLWAFARARTGGDRRYVVALAFGAGLAAGHHAELRLFALVAALGIGVDAARRRWAIGAAGIWPLAVALLLGAACVAYLPLRSAADPWRDWGDPETLAALWSHWTGARIRLAFADRFGAPSPEDLWTFARQCIAGAPVLLTLALPGFALLLRRPGGWLVPALWLTDALYAVALNPMGLADAQNGAPGMVTAGVGAAVALEAVVARWPSALRRTAWALPVAAVGGAAAVALPAVDRHRERAAPAMVDAALEEAPPGSVLFVASDDMAAGLAFAQVVEGARPDVAVVVRQHVWDPSSIEPVRRRLPGVLTGWRPGARLTDLDVLATRARPIRWEWAVGEDAAARPPDLGPRFPLFAPGAVDDGGFERRLRVLAEDLPAGAVEAPDGRRLFARALVDLGLWRLGAGAPVRAIGAFEAAARLHPASASAWTNLGVALSSVGRYEEAAAATRRALAVDPGDRNARVNLVRYLVNLNRDVAAGPHVRALLDRDPADADGLALRGLLRARAGDLESARRDFEAALRRDPNQPEARAGMARLRRARSR